MDSYRIKITNRYVEEFMNYVLLIGRILFSLIFISSGLMGHFASMAGTTQYAEMSGVPMASIAVIVSGIMLLLGGLSVLLGYMAKIGSMLLFVFLIASAFMVHHFWTLTDPMMMQVQMAMFMKNISLAGASLIIFFFGTGPLSLQKN